MAIAIDIHPHIVANDRVKYPHHPMHSVNSSHWTEARPVTIEGLIAAMDQAHVLKAALVQASSCYSYDNSYLCDSLARFPERFTGVGFVDVLQPDALKQIQCLISRGISGLRLFTATNTGSFDLSLLEDPRSAAVWDLCGSTGLSMSLQADGSCMAQVAAFARRFPKVKLVLDHAARPDVSDGPTYKNASSLFSLAPFENIFLKLMPRIFEDSRRGKATPETLFPLMVEVFGANRLAWGSNFPASEGDYGKNLEEAKASLSCLSERDREWIFGGTAVALYPKLAD
jgi:predicted TIM-barrel fold metal-dependent hydrolase